MLSSLIRAYASVIEVGSSHTTTTTSCAAREKLTTISEIPAAVSMSKISISSSNVPNARISPTC
ncbi:Uncharacterised protein [Vibrio cholerae]|nr:Uncharacterised protein [Vibrio cholerae]